MELTELQGIFGFFYAVQYSSMLGSLGGLQPFPWGFAHESSPHRWRLAWRLVVSLVVLNVLPLIVFAYGYLELDSYQEPLGIWIIVFAGMASFAVYAPYRIYHVLYVLLKGTVLDLYDETQGRDDSPTIKSRLAAIRPTVFGHFLAIFYYSLPFCMLMYFASWANR